jgi:hypothetical protein
VKRQRRRVNFQTRSMGFSSGLYGGRKSKTNWRCCCWRQPRWSLDRWYEALSLIRITRRPGSTVASRRCQELPECRSVEPLGLAAENQSAVAEPDGSEVPHAFSGRVMKYDWVLILPWNPHPAPRALLIRSSTGRPSIERLFRPWTLVCASRGRFWPRATRTDRSGIKKLRRFMKVAGNGPHRAPRDPRPRLLPDPRRLPIRKDL